MKHNVDAYETNCADIGYGFLPFSFSSFGELEKDAVAFWGIREGCDGLTEADLKVLRGPKHYIFSRISFAIAIGVRAHIISRLRTNFLS
ncbi:hypothetical protein Tco_1487967 [Tanacetum coccineum]